jgi:hypothetical protein
MTDTDLDDESYPDFMAAIWYVPVGTDGEV